MRFRRSNEPTARRGHYARRWIDRPSCFRCCMELWNCYFVRGEFQRRHDLADGWWRPGGARGAAPSCPGPARARHDAVPRSAGSPRRSVNLNEGVAFDDAAGARPRASLCSTRSAPASCAGCIRGGSLWSEGFPIAPWRKSMTGWPSPGASKARQRFAFALRLRRRSSTSTGEEFDLARERSEATIDLHGELCCRSGSRRERLPRLCPRWPRSAGRRRRTALCGMAGWNATGCRLFDNPVAWLHHASPSRAGQSTTRWRARSGRRSRGGDGRALLSSRAEAVEADVLLAGGRRACQAAAWLQQRDRYRAQPAREVPGAARGHQPRTAVGRTRKERRGARPSRAGLRLVRRGLRNQGFCRDAGALLAMLR